MDRSYASGAAGSAPAAPASPSIGYPTAGNPGTGTPATKPGPYWYHMVMEELMAIITAGGITPAPGTLNQVKQALDVLYQPAGSQLGGMKNRIINGAMAIDQRNNGAAVTPTATGYTIDRWQLACTQASKLTVQRVTDAPPGAAFSLKVSVASQYAPIATDIFNVNQPIEGNNVVDLQFGTSGALQITTSFQVKASVAGTYSCAVHNGALNRSYVATYTIASANIWTPLVITIPGDQSGTWATDNTTGLWIDFDLGSGSNANAAAGAWSAGNLKRTSGSVTFVNQTAGATWQLAKVQIERGAVSSPTFEPRNFGQELGLCQRYYEPLIATIYGSCSPSSTNSYAYWFFKTQKRVAPTVVATYTGSVVFNNVDFHAATAASTNAAINGGATASAEL